MAQASPAIGTPHFYESAKDEKTPLQTPLLPKWTCSRDTTHSAASCMLDTSPTARHVLSLPLGFSPPSPTWRHLFACPDTYLSTREMEVEWSNPNSSSSTESESSSHGSRLEEVELDAARALADLAKIEKERIDLNESKSRNEQFQRDSQDSKAVSEDLMPKKIKSSHDAELSVPNIQCTSSHGSCFGRRMKQDMTEAEREAKRIRRVLANRESARQTIRRRQALREELIRRVSELSTENANMKMEKELVMREYQALEETNKKLKERVAYSVKMKVEIEAEITPDSPSTELSLVVQCPGVSSTNKSSYEEAGGNVSSASNTHLYAPPVCTVFYPILQQNTAESYTSTHHHGFVPFSQFMENLDSTTIAEASRLTATLEEKNMNVNIEETNIDLNQNKIFQHDPGGSVANRSEKDIMDINAGCEEIRSFVEEKSQAAMKRLVDPNAAAAARRRRKELTKLKYLHGKQIRLHG